NDDGNGIYDPVNNSENEIYDPINDHKNGIYDPNDNKIYDDTSTSDDLHSVF
ncbi:18688_t:CDS:1, partial [Funneliformis geosporum]